jgi:hypothetical protein
MALKEAGFRIRIDDKLRADFIAACRTKDLTAAQVLRNFMRDYVAQNPLGQAELFQSPVSPAPDA